MERRPLKLKIKMKREQNDINGSTVPQSSDGPITEQNENDSTVPSNSETNCQDPSPGTKSEDPGTETKTQDPSPEAKTQDPSPEAKTQDPSPEAKMQDPSPEAKTQDPSPEAKTQDPSPEAKTQDPGTETKTQDPSSETEPQHPSLETAAKNSKDSSGEEEHSTEDEGNGSGENAQNQLVLYDPAVNGTGEIVPVPDHVGRSPFSRFSSLNQPSRVLPSVGAFTVQCANCFKWRLIPTKEKYEEIREHILEDPFLCETAREWRPDISCDDPPDISQDGSRLWAIDKPNIAQPPPGWERLLRIRGEGSTKFADVYYVAPSGKRMRSMVEVQKHLAENPQYAEQGVSLSQFSFQIPRPLQENYLRKRPSARSAPSHDGSGSARPGSTEPSEVNPISWAAPDEDTELQLGMSERSAPLDDVRPVKKRKTPPKQKPGEI